MTICATWSWHAHALGVQEALEVEAVLYGVDVGDVQAVADHAARRAAAAGADGDAAGLGVADEVRDDEEVVDKAHALYHVQLILHLRPGVLARGAVAALKALGAELFEVFKAVALALRQLEAGQVVVPELKVEAALGGDLRRVVRGVGAVGKERAHLVLALEVELLRLKAHALGVVHRLAGLDAHQHVLVIGVGLVYIVRVVRQRKGDARLVVDAQDAPGGRVLLGDAVALDLEVEVVAEDLAQLQRPLPGLFVLAVDYLARDVAGEAAGEADQTLGVLAQQRPVDARLDVEALGEAHGDEIAEVAVARLVLAQQDEVGVAVVDAVLAVGQRAGRDIDLAAGYGLDAGLAAGAVEVDRAVHDAVVGDGQRVEAQSLGALGEGVYPALAVEQAVFRMHMQVNKAHPLYSSEVPSRAMAMRRLSRWLRQLLVTLG